jgi:hypothetical protein
MVIGARVNAGEILVVDRAGQVQADDLGTDGTAERADFKGLRRECLALLKLRTSFTPTHGAPEARTSIRNSTDSCWFGRAARRLVGRYAGGDFKA